MPRRIPKFKRLLDENFPLRAKLTRLNHRFNLKHLKHDLNKESLEDSEVYQLAGELGRIIVTFNDKDFRGMEEKGKKTGIISVSNNLSNEQIDKKLTAFLMRKTLSNIYGKFHYISGESKEN